MRILHCIPSVWPGSGGPSRAVVAMCRAIAIAEPGYQVDIATTDYRLPRSSRDEVEAALPRSSNLLVFPISRGLDAGWSLPMIRWLAGAARGYDVLHIHALFGSTSSACAHVAMRKRIPYVIRPLGTLSPYTFANRRRLLKRLYFSLIDRRSVERAYAVHFTAPQEQAKASRLELDIRPVVIPIPFDSPASPRGRAAGSPPHILFLSRLHPVKGLDLLLPAFARIRAVVPDAILVVAGSGTPAYEKGLRAEAQRLGVAEAVQFCGFVQGEAKARLLAEATIFVLPSYQENFGVAVVEALTAALPVVITDEVDLWQDVARYQSGLVVKPNERQIADAVIAILGDESRASEMGANGLRQVRELYAPATVGRQLASLYRAAAVNDV